MYNVTALGELLIDFTPAGVSAAGNVLFERNPGGAPANVLAAITKLGGAGAFIGKVGNDQFGHFLKQVLNDNSIETKGLKFSHEVNTTLAFVHLDEKGDRSFSFYRKPGADTTLEIKDLEFDLIDKTEIFHFGSLSMTEEPSKSATLKAVEYAKNKGRIISYDPNWRPPLWKNDIAAKEGMELGLKYADILKISEIELEFLTGVGDLDKGSKIFFDMGIKLIVVTLGPKGCYYRCNAGTGLLPTYDTKVVDTTGAGDAFFGGLLYMVGSHHLDLNNINKPEIEAAIDFSNAVGSTCASKRGAIPAMPTLSEVKHCMSNTHKLI
jgi:Sugar kinases, ribokinase family